jgi:nucleoid-associated protein YgaU
MTSLTLLYPGGPQPTGDGPRRRVVLSSSNNSRGAVTFTITDPETEHTGLGNRWVEVPRPGGRPFLHNAGAGNRKFRVKATLYADPPGNVLHDLNTVMFFHALADKVTLSYSWLETIEAVVTDLRVTVKQRVEGSNEPYWADLELELTDRPPDLKQLAPVPAPAAAPPPPAPPAPPAGTWYVVKRGDTLAAIAVHFYQHADRYMVIATANGIRNPNLIVVGQRLLIP